MTDIKALLLEAANVIDGDTPFNTEARISAVMAFDRRMADIGRRLRAAAASMGEPVAVVTSDHADGFGTGEYQTPSMDGLEPGTKLYAAPPPPAVPDECPHMIVFEDTEVKPMLFAGCGARDAAMKAWENACISWTAHLFVRVAASCKNDPYPSATLAAPEQPKAGAVPDGRDAAHRAEVGVWVETCMELSRKVGELLSNLQASEGKVDILCVMAKELREMWRAHPEIVEAINEALRLVELTRPLDGGTPPPRAT